MSLIKWEDEREKVEIAEGLISGFYENRVPEFRQGPPTHEFESLVTAEEVTGYVGKVEELRAALLLIMEYTRYTEDGQDAFTVAWKALGSPDQ